MPQLQSHFAYNQQPNKRQIQPPLSASSEAIGPPYRYGLATEDYILRSPRELALGRNDILIIVRDAGVDGEVDALQYDGGSLAV
jgi:hypothetical protein